MRFVSGKFMSYFGGQWTTRYTNGLRQGEASSARPLEYGDSGHIWVAVARLKLRVLS